MIINFIYTAAFKNRVYEGNKESSSEESTPVITSKRKKVIKRAKLQKVKGKLRVK